MTAIYQRELRSYFHGMTGYVFIAFLLLFAGIYTMFYNLSSGYPNFEYVLQAMTIIFLIAIPILSMRVIAEERRQKTGQLLYTLPVGMTRVVLGKYLAMVTVVAAPCAVMALYPLLLSTFGTVSFPTAYGALVGFFLLSAALSAIGLLISSLTENQAVAAGLCFGVMLLLYFMTSLSSFVPSSAGASLGALLITVLVIAVLVRLFTRSTPAALITGLAGEAILLCAYLTVSDSFAGLFGRVVDGLYSLSSQTQQLVSGLEDEVAVYWIVQSGSEDSTIGELLERYQDLSKNLKVERKDPVVYPNFAQQYTSDTLYNNSLIVVCGERSRYISYYAIYVTDYSSYYTTGTSSTQFDGESQLTSAVDYVTNSDLPVVYTITGHGESQLPDSLSSGAESENLLLEELNLLTQETVPEDADALILYSPQSDISADEKDMLLTYLQGGGKLLLVTDYTDTEMPNLAELMDYYGTSLVDGIVMEGDSGHHVRGSNYYLLPNLSSHDITAPLADGGYYVLMPVAQGIAVSDELRDGVTVNQMLTTTDSAYAKPDGYNLTTYDKEDGDIDGPFTLGVAISEEVEGGTTGIVWLTTSYMFDDQTDMLVSGANTDLFLNALDWMCQRESAISIRAKTLSAESLTVPSADQSTWSLILVVTLPAAFLIAGAYVTVTRRKR